MRDQIITILGILAFQGNDLNQIAAKLGLSTRVRDSHDAVRGVAAGDEAELLADVESMATEQAVLVQQIEAKPSAHRAAAHRRAARGGSRCRATAAGYRNGQRSGRHGRTL